MKGVRPDQYIIDDALRRYAHDLSMTVGEIAWRAGVDRKTVRTWARAAGLPARPPARERLFTAEDDALAVRLYTQAKPRLSMAEIMAKTGMSDSRVRAAAAAAGKPLRPAGRQKHDHELVVAMDREHGPNEAARRLGCSPGTVHYHREKARRLKARAELTKGRRR